MEKEQKKISRQIQKTKLVVIDSSVIIDFLLLRGSSSSWFYSLNKSHESLAVSILTHTEIYSGKSVWQKPQAKMEVEQIFLNLKIIPFTVDLSFQAGELVAKFQLDIQDAIIAATAIEHQAPLATLNTKHFSHIPNLKLLSNSQK